MTQSYITVDRWQRSLKSSYLPAICISRYTLSHIPRVRVIILSHTSMCAAQSSSLGGYKLVPSRTFCPRAVARGLAEEEKVKRRGGGRYEFSWILLWWWEDTLRLLLSRRRLGIWGGGRPAERSLRVLLYSRGSSGHRDMSWVKELFGSCLWFKILFGFGVAAMCSMPTRREREFVFLFHLYAFFVTEYCCVSRYFLYASQLGRSVRCNAAVSVSMVNGL
jgi:hypothetical protein